MRSTPSSKAVLHWLATTFILFLIFSFVGWAYEMLNDAIVRGGWHWRSSLVGPWCPIYGIGGLLIIWCFKPIRAKLSEHNISTIAQILILLVGIYLLVTCVELIGSYLCEAMMGFMPWDYSSSWGNFEGRIAPEFTLRFVIGGIIFLLLLEPWVTKWTKTHEKETLILSSILLILFVADLLLEGIGVWKSIVPRDAEVFVK